MHIYNKFNLKQVYTVDNEPYVPLCVYYIVRDMYAYKIIILAVMINIVHINWIQLFEVGH